MPLCSIEEWRARIGSCWCALGCPTKKMVSKRLRRVHVGLFRCSERHLTKIQLDPTISLCLVIFVIVTTLLKCGDVEMNPGPKTQTSKQVHMYMYMYVQKPRMAIHIRIHIHIHIHTHVRFHKGLCLHRLVFSMCLCVLQKPRVATSCSGSCSRLRSLFRAHSHLRSCSVHFKGVFTFTFTSLTFKFTFLVVHPPHTSRWAIVLAL